MIQSIKKQIKKDLRENEIIAFDVNFQNSEQISTIFVQSREQIEAKSVQPSE